MCKLYHGPTHFNVEAKLPILVWADPHKQQISISCHILQTNNHKNRPFEIGRGSENGGFFQNVV